MARVSLELEIIFADDKLEEECNSQRLLQKRHGAERAGASGGTIGEGSRRDGAWLIDPDEPLRWQEDAKVSLDERGQKPLSRPGEGFCAQFRLRFDIPTPARALLS